MFKVFGNLLNSEKAVASGVLVVASSIMVATGQLSPQEWMNYTETLLGIYVSGKTVQGAVSAIANRKSKENSSAAKGGLESLNKSVASNDAKSDKALDEKFGDPDDEPTDPGKRNASVIVEEE